MELWVWFLAGVALGVLLVLSLKRLVAQLDPEKAEVALPRVITGYFARFFVVVVALVIAIRYEALAGVLLVAGIWVGRTGMILFGLKSK
jgi:hypothetical protein